MTDLARYFQNTTRQAVATPLSVANTGGAAIGEAIMGLGEALNQISARDEEFWVAKTMADIDNDARAIRESAMQSVSDGAAGFETGYLSNLDTRYEQARQNAPSVRASRALEVQVLNHRNREADWATGFASQEKFAYRADTIRQEADNFAQELYRYPGVQPYAPTAGLTSPGLPSTYTPAAAGDFWSSGGAHPHSGIELPENIGDWDSRYYSPRDFADGANMADRSGGIMVSKRAVSALDWVTDQFGYGKLQINSGYRSPASNMARAESGPEGPHTHGEALDIQVRELPQSEKNRLYSLFRAAGFNAFGFGQGVLHVEMRDGQGDGRDGDFEWSYGGTAKYERVPIAAPGQVGGPDQAVTGEWRSPNQYPWLSAVSMTSRNETGTTDLATASLSIVPDSNGSVSYGALGLNSRGMMPGFVRDYGEQFGLTARPGTPEFDAQWERAVTQDPGGMIRAQLEFHETKIVRPAQSALVSVGAVNVANDPRVVAFAADLVTQYGATIAKRHLGAGTGAGDATSFINAVTASTKSSLDADFASAINADPSIRGGLMNRIDSRARDAMSIAGATGTVATGMVPPFNGPVPNIEDIPGYADRMARIDAMIDTMGGTPDQRRDLREEMTAQITRSWLSRMAEVNPSAAMAALMSGRYDNAIEVADTATLMGASQSAYKRMEAEIQQAHRDLIANLKVEAQTALADEIASVATTGQSLGRLTNSHMAVLTDAEKADLSFARFTYDTGRNIATAPARELPGILEELTPHGEGFAEEQRRYEWAAEQIGSRLENQQNDPAGTASRTYELLNRSLTEALASGDSSRVTSAIRSLRAAQVDMGVPPALIRSLPQATMEANQSMFTTAEDADTAFARFMELRSIYGSEFGRVVTEMEAAGLERGWSDVNGLVESGNVLLGKSLARVVHAGAYDLDAELGVAMARSGQQDVARLIFDGRLRREEITGILPTGRDDQLDESVLQTLGRSMGDAFVGLHPSTTEKVREAALSVYAAQATLGDPYSAEMLDEAVGMVSGGILEWNSAGTTGKLVPPRPGMTQAQWDNLAMGITQDDLEGAYTGFTEHPEKVNVGMLRTTLQFVAAGDNVYFLRWPGEGLIDDVNGNPFELDLSGKIDALIDRGASMQTVDRTEIQPAEGAEPAAPYSTFDPFQPGGIFDNFDPNTGEWTPPSQ